MLLRIIQIITTLFILASLILQLIALLGNFPKLRSVYISKITITSTTGGIFANLLSSIPDYFTVGVFIICQGFYINTANNLCAPSSFGYEYESTGLLQTIQEALPSSTHSTLKGVQGGIMIPSVCFCCIVLLNEFRIYIKPNKGWFLHVFTFIVAVISLLLSAAFFAVLVAIYYIINNVINDEKSVVLGGNLGRFVSITTEKGSAIWISMVAFILMFFACCLMLVRFIFHRRARSVHQNSHRHEMSSTAY
ncbi:hypothetical protein K501DRAFT_328930 [Backusella circina FSU 941]|nr:hypothetical protein K501DRAFT_328930 [Backusella circina FSU 941]